MTAQGGTQKSTVEGPLRWASGVELVQTTMDSLHIVGDVEQPVVLSGVGRACVDWLRAIEGDRSFPAEVGLAQTFGVEPRAAREMLTSLRLRKLLVAEAQQPKLNVAVFGSGQVATQTAEYLSPGSPPRAVARPSVSPEWRQELEALVDEVAGHFVVLELARPVADAVDVEIAAQLNAAGIDYLPIGAGPHSARVGPLCDSTAACLCCEDRFREQLEPQWRRIASQLGYDVKKAPSPTSELSALAAGEGVRQVKAYFAGERPSAVGAVLETGYRGGAWRHRPVTRNHQCECWWPR